ncbi:ligase [Lithospermum erythrorhizon]|uniref:Ligase n=1 Tax=Lithospermum erythrorhizon TaxID=34254 RepID=A0AAV3Q3P1_LITER
MIMNHFVKKASLTNWSIGNLKEIRPSARRKCSPVSCQLPKNLESESWRSIDGMVKCSANYVPLTPISFLERSAKVFKDRKSVVYGPVEYTWEETHARCVKLASALAQLGISPGDVVATLAPNIPVMNELHFAIPMAGGVICTLNTRHDANMISVLLRHSEAKAIFVDYQWLEIAQRALDILAEAKERLPILVLIPESEKLSLSVDTSHTFDYETLLLSEENDFQIRRPETELDPISVNYTSGTTSHPKGVVFNHRGAYLNAIATTFLHQMSIMPVYLWTVPMFHCNGWCLSWGVAALGGTNICLRDVNPKDIYDNIERFNVTHMSGAPTVLNKIVNTIQDERRPLPHKVEVTTGGAPPPPEILYKMEELGIGVNHLYGLTETYAAGTYCVWKPEWDSLPPGERFKRKALQGVQNLCVKEVDVKDPITMESVPADGKTLGEVVFRGNTVMSGYLKDSKATEDAFRGGWFWSGDLAVKHPDNYILVKDRSKDIIISGGENISTVEVEAVLEHLPHYMAPQTVIFSDLPKTSTGKVQKTILREKAKDLGSLF